MAERQEYEMTESDLEELKEASRSVPYMIVGGMEPMSPQENANRAWADLGSRMRFQPMTVRPVPGKGQRFFTAEPVERRLSIGHTYRDGRRAMDQDRHR